MIGGIIGATLGLVCAVAAITWNVRQNKRAGAARPVAEALGLGAARSSVGIERAIASQAARIAFPLYAAFAVTFTWVNAGSSAAGVLGGVAGATYGMCAAFTGRRLAR